MTTSVSYLPLAPFTHLPAFCAEWYTEATPNNRMVLAARSGIPSEITWAMDRICRASDHPQFIARNIPGMLDALFTWPEWYIEQSKIPKDELKRLFSPSEEEDIERRHALHSIFALRNLSVNPPNAVDLASRERTRRLIFSALHHLDPSRAQDAEFLLDAMEIYKNMASTTAPPPLSFPPDQSPIKGLERIVHDSNDRTLSISAFHVLASMLNSTANAHYLKPSSPALEACVRFLPVISFGDKDLAEACLTYLYAHLSHPPMAKAFLIHHDMPSILRLLVCVILQEQPQEVAYLEVGEPPHTPKSTPTTFPAVELSREELDTLSALPEPQRYTEW